MYKASHPFAADVILPDFSDDDATVTTTTTKSRRVSFGTNFVKEFIVGSAVSAQCVSEYEETFISSDSSNANSSHSVVDNHKSNQLTFVGDENHSNQKLETLSAPVLDSNNADNASKVSKFSSTICFSSDSPTADLEFTGGCINLAKSILKKKNQDMTVIISSKPKAEKNLQPKDKTIYFEESEFDMSMTKVLLKDESDMEEEINESKIKVFDESNICTRDLSLTETPNVTNYNSCMSVNDSFKVNTLNQMPINLIMQHLDNNDSDLDDSLFHPKKSFDDVLNSGPFNDSIKIENSCMNLLSNSENLTLPKCDTSEECPTPLEDSSTSNLPIENSEEKFSGSKVIEMMEMSEELQPVVKENDFFDFEKEISINESPEHHEETESKMEMDSFISQEQILAVEREMTIEMTKYAEEPLESEHEMSIEAPLSELQHEEGEPENIFHDTMMEMMGSDSNSSATTELQQEATQNLTKNKLENNISEEELPDKSPQKMNNCELEPSKTYENVENEKSVSPNHSNFIHNSIEVEPTEKKEIFHKSVELEGMESTKIKTSVPFGLAKPAENAEENFHSEPPIIAEVENVIEKIDAINIDEEDKTESEKMGVEKSKNSKDKDCSEVLNLENGFENQGERETEKINEEEFENLSKRQKENLVKEIKAAENAEENVTESKEINVTEVEVRNHLKSCNSNVTNEDDENCPVVQEFELTDHEETRFNQDLSFRKFRINRDSILQEEDDNREVGAKGNENNQIAEVERNESDQNIDEKSKGNLVSENDAESNGFSFVDSEVNKLIDKSAVADENKEVELTETQISSQKPPTKTEMKMSCEQTLEGKVEGKQVEKSSEVEKTKLEEKNRGKEKSKYKNPPMMDQKVLENLREQSMEKGCIWEAESVKYGEDEWTFRFRMLKSHISARVKLQESDRNAYSDVKSIEIEKIVDKTPRRKEYGPTFEFGFEKFNNLVEQEKKLIKTVLNVPYFLDRMNIFGSKLNGYLDQMYEILTKYPGSLLSGSLLSFRLFSFPLFFSTTVSIDLVDLYGLSKSSLSFLIHLGKFDEKKVGAIFEDCLESENPLTGFVIRSTEYFFELEKKTKQTTKRGHISLLPPHIR